ncbi:hypothetical protein CPAR01_08430 [Colletotrichum paranaense]|uniref:Uncharacterized protein n=1 Tax=Colletotrichum paranaense TaxID=1914294 RepID=A0ABQ9SLL1_9PEZI|nr:uncharacterized protein CPAR01_08430 [Colletotrichum paranaense]KAK1538317.1 hypothetical protein CPAR01_08430 [Colletotrichum paranaense]
MLSRGRCYSCFLSSHPFSVASGEMSVHPDPTAEQQTRIASYLPHRHELGQSNFCGSHHWMDRHQTSPSTMDMPSCNGRLQPQGKSLELRPLGVPNSRIMPGLFDFLPTNSGPNSHR